MRPPTPTSSQTTPATSSLSQLSKSPMLSVAPVPVAGVVRVAATSGTVVSAVTPVVGPMTVWSPGAMEVGLAKVRVPGLVVVLALAREG